MQNLPILDLRGSPRARGLAHGETLRAQIQSAVARWQEALARSTNISADQYIAEFTANTHFHSTIEKWTPELAQEVDGVARGANVDAATMYAYQLMDEEWWYQRYHFRAPPLTPNEHCSALAVFQRAGQPTLLAQNMDVNSFYDESQTLLRIAYPDSDLQAMVFTAAGLLVLNGVNNYGIGICVNTLLQLDHATDGLPVAFIIRRLLEQKTQADAVAFLTRVPHASGQNYMIGAPEHVFDFECSAQHAVRYVPRQDANFVYHTNHPLVNDQSAMFEILSASLSLQEQESMARTRANSQTRFDFLEGKVRANTENLAVEEVKQWLRTTDDAPICVTRNRPGWLTLGSVIMELAVPPTLHLAPGPPDETPYATYCFS